MNRAELITHLQDVGCVVVRTDKAGYSIIRNVVTGKMTGLPVNDPVLAATVCRVCKTLEVDIPDNEYVIKAKAIVDFAHKNHNKDKE